VNGSPVAAVDDLVDHLSGDLIGSTIPLVVVRGAGTEDLSVTVGERD
jgi:S1-C subfamily serine protease